MPLPPRTSRAQPTVSRIRTVLCTLHSEACSSLSEPASCSCEVRTFMAIDAVTLLSILTSRSCTSWNEPIDLPSCSPARRVAQRMLEGAAGTTGGLPRHVHAGHPQHPSRVGERVGPSQPVGFGNPNARHMDLGVLNHAQGNLV